MAIQPDSRFLIARAVKRLGVVIGALSLQLAMPPLAQAQSEPETEPPVEAPAAVRAGSEEAFGWQVLVADAAAVGAGLAASRGVSSPVPVLVTFALAAPIVHLAHGDGAGTAGSLALHVLTPLVGSVVGFALTFCDSDEPGCHAGSSGVLFGALVGAALATTIDVTMLSTVRRDPPPAGPQFGPYMAMPTLGVDPRNGGITFGLSGRL